MKCIYCNKEINPNIEGYSPRVCGGEFIHDDCKMWYQKEMDDFCAMCEKELYDWMMEE